MDLLCIGVLYFIAMSITKKLRFEVFKRDSFKCQYCGKTPPEVTLEVDHIKPKSKKGTDDINNLITACFDCNRGKKHIELTKLPNTLLENAEILKEKELQYKEYQKLIDKINKRIDSEIQKVNEAYNLYFPNYVLTEKFKTNTVKKFIKTLGINEVLEAMNSACYKIKDSDGSIKYFCGICWNIIKNKGNGI